MSHLSREQVRLSSPIAVDLRASLGGACDAIGRALPRSPAWLAYSPAIPALITMIVINFTASYGTYFAQLSTICRWITCTPVLAVTARHDCLSLRQTVALTLNVTDIYDALLSNVFYIANSRQFTFVITIITIYNFVLFLTYLPLHRTVSNSSVSCWHHCC